MTVAEAVALLAKLPGRTTRLPDVAELEAKLERLIR
jgi:hypothetical protein